MEAHHGRIDIRITRRWCAIHLSVGNVYSKDKSEFSSKICSLNISSKWLALLGAAMLILDYTATAVVSAATAAAYLAGEVALPFPPYVGALILLVIFTIISLSGLRESARLALAVLSLHVILFSFIVSNFCTHNSSRS